jgi:hypothetical protein
LAGIAEEVQEVGQLGSVCHPERSEGSAFCSELQIPRFARDDNLYVER